MPITVKFGSKYLLSPSGSLFNTLERWGENPKDYYVHRSPLGASQWGVFTAAILTADLTAIRTASGTAGGSLTLSTDDYEIVIPSMSLIDAGIIDATGTFTRVTFADPRYLLQWKLCSFRINMTKPTLDSTDYIGTTTYLPDIVALLTTALGISTGTFPDGYDLENPDNLILKSAPAAKALDALLRTYGLVVVYDPITGVYSVQNYGGTENSADVTAFAVDDTNLPTKQDLNTTEKANSPEKVKVIYENVDAYDDNSDSQSIVNSTAGRPTAYIPGTAVGLPAPNYGYDGGTALPGTPDLIGDGFFEIIQSHRRQPFIGLIVPPINGAVEEISWHLGLRDVFTVVSYSPRPARLWNDTFNQSAHLGISSRIDAFGRPQYRTTKESMPMLLIITGYTGAGPTSWGPYQTTLMDGETDGPDIWNGFEPCAGSPGTLGVNISADDGTVNGTDCVVQPIGNATVLALCDPLSGRWWFSAPNSAQVP